MLQLTFGEQIKIILSRKNMTIKELAETIQEKTGKKMSRQNLTQRLGRDNFQEQDMHMIVEILGCSLQLSVLEDNGREVEKDQGIEPTESELEKLTRKKKKEKIAAIKKEAREVMQEIEHKKEVAQEVVEDAMEEVKEFIDDIKEPVKEVAKAVMEVSSNGRDITVGELADIGEKPREGEAHLDTSVFKRKPKNEEVRRPEFRSDVLKKEEKKGEINPYTGIEYKTNSVRTHPNRIGYVQVYDRGEHKWTDMTEWAFLGYQERKKALLGKEYEPPIYLD